MENLGLPSFLAPTDLNISSIVNQEGLFVDADGDLVSQLQTDLKAKDRPSAASHFIERNQPELKAVLAKLLEVTNDVTLGCALMRPNGYPQVLAPLKSLLKKYVEAGAVCACLIFCPWDFMPERRLIFLVDAASDRLWIWLGDATSPFIGPETPSPEEDTYEYFTLQAASLGHFLFPDEVCGAVSDIC